MKGWKTTSIVMVLVSSLFSIPKITLAAEECGSFSAAGPVICLPDSSQCDFSPEVKLKIKYAYSSVKKGTLDSSEAFVTGVCNATAVCCIKKPGDTGSSTGNSGYSSTTSNGEGCGSICQWIKSTYTKPENYDGPIPDCAFSGTCRNTNDLVQVLIEQGKVIFGFIGMVALAAFVYGGFLMVFSFGASDRVQQGKDVMVAAVIGIIIVFSAYLLINFVLNALGVSQEFQAIK